MSKIYFMSDAHLGLGSKEEDRAKENRLIAFLDLIKKDADQLFILGDLFDAWFEYRTVIPKGYHRLFTKLEECADKNIKIHYLAGNHDYWIRDFFQTELRIKTYKDAFETIIDGKKIFIHHGDGLSLNDTGYKLLRPILRNPVSIWLYTWLHPDLGISLARASSKKSRQYTADKKYGEEDGMVRFATEKIEGGFDVVIMGHRHVPTQLQIGRGCYVNLGDWITNNSYAAMLDGKIELKYWK
jgi:UDP-2,3-diacylglucosamine hydrolase